MQYDMMNLNIFQWINKHVIDFLKNHIFLLIFDTQVEVEDANPPYLVGSPCRTKYRYFLFDYFQ